jgi:deazaflavin-dependent oxidoreductase (nitroreductase family)
VDEGTNRSEDVDTKDGEEPVDSALGWVAEHTRRYVASGGEDGYMFFGAPTVILTTRGRKSGDLRRNALIFGRDGDDYILVASYGGRPHHPMWYLNLAAEPRVTIQDRAAIVDGVAETVEDEGERKRLLDQMVSIYAPYEEYQGKTTRQIPIVRVRPTA